MNYHRYSSIFIDKPYTFPVLLHFLLASPPRELSVTSRLRTASTYPRPTTRTKRYTSIVQHGLLHYQTEQVEHHLSTQALSSFIYYCYFCCIDIQYCACILNLYAMLLFIVKSSLQCATEIIINLILTAVIQLCQIVY